MSQSKWEPWTKQLLEYSDPKARRKACQKLVATRDPAVIPFLRKAYFDDSDETVREAARDGLAFFKAVSQNKRIGPQLPIGNRTLTGLLSALAILLVISLVLNGLQMVLSGGEDEEKTPDLSGDPANRNVLVTRIQNKIGEARELSSNLSGEIANYNATGQVACPLSYTMPEPVALPGIDRYTYPDLKLVGDKLDVTLLPLQTALLLLSSACTDPSTQTAKVLEASDKLNQVNAQLGEVDQLLQTAITNPAATVGPTETPLPTWTFTPTVTNTATPITPTLPTTATAQALATALGPGETPTPRPGISPTATLPFPADLDYRAILRELRGRDRIMADLQSSFGDGMIDQWEKSRTGGQPTRCTFDAWPAPFELTAEQLTALHAPGVADPLLEEAIRLQRGGVELAFQARALFERDCASSALANSASEGTRLATQALERLTEAQAVVDEIQARPES